MTQPTPYRPSYDFGDAGTALPPGVPLDTELLNIQRTFAQILKNLSLIQKDDTSLRNGIVGVDQFDARAMALIGSGAFTVAGDWVSGTDYGAGAFFGTTEAAYLTLVKHTATTIIDDLAAGNIVQVFQNEQGNRARDDFTGDGITTEFTLSQQPARSNDVEVYFDGTLQDPALYTVTGSIVTFAVAPANAVAVSIFSLFWSTTPPIQSLVDALAIATADVNAQLQAANAAQLGSEAARDLSLSYSDTASAQPGLAAAQVALATTAKTDAVTAKTQAEASALAAAALSAGRVFASTAAGITGTVDTNPFMVPDGSTGNLALWLNVAGVATAVGSPQFKLLGVEGYAALAGQAPAYTNAGGQGDRTATVTVTAIGITPSGGTPDNLVDGVAASTTGDGYRLAASTAVSGMRIRFDFGPGARRIITEATFKFQNTNSLATWKWSASNDLVSFTDIGANLTLASATTQVMTELSANRLGYRYYDLVGVSGSTHATVNYIQEAEFKIAATDGDGITAMPSGGTAGQELKKTSAVNGAAEWIDPKEPAGRSLLNHLWLCDEGHGTILRDSIGGVNFNLAGGATEVNIGSGGSIAWVNGELVLTYAAISTLASVTAQTTILICEAVVDAAHFAIGLGNSNNQMHTTIRFAATAPKLKMLHSLGVNDPVTNGNNTQYGFSNGGTTGSLSCEAAPVAGPIIINANRNTDWAGMNTNLAQPFRVLAIATMATEPTAGEAATIQDYMDWLMWNRGRVLTGKRARRRAAVAIFAGESTHHTSKIMDGEPALTQAMRQDPLNISIASVMGPTATGALMPIQNLTYWRDEIGLGYQLGNESKTLLNNTAEHDRNRKMGPAYGFAFRHRYAPTPREVEMFIFKCAQGSTHLAPYGSSLAAGGTLDYGDTFDAGVTTGSTLFTSVQCQGWGKFEAALRTMGYGIDYLRQYVARGINDASNLSAGVIANAAAWQGWRQAEHDRFKGFVGVTTLPTTTLVAHLPVPGNAETYAGQLGQPGVTGYPNTAAGQVMLDNLLKIRAGERLLASSEIKVREGDAYGTDIALGDSVHPPFVGLKQMGSDYRLDYSFTAKVVPAYAV